MHEEIEEQLLSIFCDVKQPFTGSIADYSKQFVSIPEGSPYSITGKVDFRTSPWLLAPLESIQDPKIRMVVKASAPQTAKSTTDEAGAIPYWISEAPGPILRVSPDDPTAKLVTEQRLYPVLQNCTKVAPLLGKNSLIKEGIRLPHMFIRVSGDKDSIAHGGTYRYLVLDDQQQFSQGITEKLFTRTDAFAGRRKIIISAMPTKKTNDLYKYYTLGKIFQWQWCCPNCKTYQAYVWWKRRDDDSYSGFRFDDFFNDDGSRNIAASAKTTWLECDHCKHHVNDTPEERSYLNDTGKYVCIKTDGDPEVHAYTWPKIVNVNIPFREFALQFFNAKYTERITGDDEDLQTFYNQVFGEFYEREVTKEISKLILENYNPLEKWDKEGVRILTADIMRSGMTKYYVVRSWGKGIQECRQLERNIVRNWEELKEVQKRWEIDAPCVGIDCGDGEEAHDIYSRCIEFGDIINQSPMHWTALKGDDASDSKFRDEKGVFKLYSQPFQGDPLFANDHKFKGMTATGYRWDSTRVKSILARLRDGLIPGYKWITNISDKDYEQQMWSEGWVRKLNDKTGLMERSWKVHSDVNHWFDCEAMNLLMAIMLGFFTIIEPPKVEEEKKAA